MRRIAVMATDTPTRVAVVGGGPGGYAAAFHAADLGMQVTLVDEEQDPGGVCLYRGCIPSKALLHVAAVIRESAHASQWGVRFAPPAVDLDRLRAFKNQVVGKLTGGLGVLSRQRHVDYVRGRAALTGPRSIRVARTDGTTDELKASVGTSSLQLTLADRADNETARQIVANMLHTEVTLSPEAGRMTAPLQNTNVAADVLLRLREANIAVEEIAVAKPSLDEVFLTITGRPADTDSGSESDRSVA